MTMRTAEPLLLEALFPRTNAATNALLILTSSLLVALCAQVSLPLPFTPVPLTGQTFAVLLVGATFGPRRAAATLLLYLAEGAAGLPVFSPGGPSGLARLAGPTGGYLMAFPAAAFLVGWLLARVEESSPVRRYAGWFVAVLASETLILVAGAAWLKFALGLSWEQSLLQGLLPFLPGDVIKAAAVTALLPAARQAAQRRSA